MALILNIDTALDDALVSLAEDGNVLESAINAKRNDHAAWIHRAIQRIMEDGSYSMRNLNAVGVSIGPGSYTGLRIALSTAKGLCYALQIPLIAVGTLEVLAYSAVAALTGATADSSPSKETLTFPDAEMLLCPMIDARRMEVFTAVYDSNLQQVMKPHALILNEHSFGELLSRRRIIFFGNGSLKFQQICQNTQAVFKNIPLSPLALAKLIYRNFIGNNFAGLAYTEPLYIKEFFTINPGRVSKRQ
jgi:tRNA threonylcarbamoyladenosine biosynthesis protein TsaB